MVAFLNFTTPLWRKSRRPCHNRPCMDAGNRSKYHKTRQRSPKKVGQCFVYSRLCCIFATIHYIYCICHTPKKAFGLNFSHRSFGLSVRRCACGVGINLFTVERLGGRNCLSVSPPSFSSSSSPVLPFRSISFGYSDAHLRCPASCIRKMLPPQRSTVPTINS